MSPTVESDILAVWSSENPAGRLARETKHRYVFAYDPAAPESAQVSLTMPFRLQSWTSSDLHPVFQMNLPEGALLEAIRRAVAKVAGEDDLTILRVTGGNQIGRNRFARVGDERPGLAETRESLDELLTYPDTTELFHELVSRYALRSGISGVQPKVMLEAVERGTLTTAGYIVKSWGAEYPQLALNEFFCMSAVKRAGLPVPEFYCAENGGLFIMKRFDINAAGIQLGFEDMCSLQGMGTAQKYGSSYERVARSIRDFVSGENQSKAREQFFAMLVLTVLLRNGDAHLKNFGVQYEAARGAVQLAPAYDVVTTTAYLKKDVPALSLAGTKKWWPRKMLEQFAVAHLSLPIGTIGQIIERLTDAVAETRTELVKYTLENPEFKETGAAMATAWEEGICGMRQGTH